MPYAFNVQQIKKLVQIRRPRKFGALLFPKRFQREYEKAIQAVVSEIFRSAMSLIGPRYENLQRQRQVNLPAAIRKDGWDDDVDALISELKTGFSAAYTKEQLVALSLRTGRPLAFWTRRQLQEGLKRVTGLDVVASEPWLENELTFWGTQNAALVTKMSEESMLRIQQKTFEAVRNGDRFASFSESIAKEEGISMNRAKLIARDQTAKLTADLNQLRQAEVGVKKYIWRTSQDDRVRSTHASKEGKIFSWDEPPEDTGHPGSDINCRCWAEPVIEF